MLCADVARCEMRESFTGAEQRPDKRRGRGRLGTPTNTDAGVPALQPNEESLVWSQDEDPEPREPKWERSWQNERGKHLAGGVSFAMARGFHTVDFTVHVSGKMRHSEPKDMLPTDPKKLKAMQRYWESLRCRTESPSFDRLMRRLRCSDEQRRQHCGVPVSDDMHIARRRWLM